MHLIDGTCIRSSDIAARLAISKALHNHSAPGSCVVVEDALRLEEIRVALMFLTGGMVVAVRVRKGGVAKLAVHEDAREKSSL